MPPLHCFTFPTHCIICFTLPLSFQHEPRSTCTLYNLVFLICNPCTGPCHTLCQLVFKRQHSSVGQLQPDNHVDLVYVILYLLESAILFSIVNYSTFSTCFCVPLDRQLIQGAIDKEQDLSQMKNTFFILQICCYHGGTACRWFCHQAQSHSHA